MAAAFEAPRATTTVGDSRASLSGGKYKMVWTSRFRAVLWFATGWALIAVVVLIARLMAGQ
jgi:hypothetical protein